MLLTFLENTAQHQKGKDNSSVLTPHYLSVKQPIKVEISRAACEVHL